MSRINPNPKKKGHYKNECHKLMVQIWGDSKEGRAHAYFWLNQVFGKDIHFSKIENESFLKEIWEKLWAKSFEVEPIKVYSTKKKSKKKEIKLQVLKVPKKCFIAPNVLELQRNHKTIIRRSSFWEKLKTKIGL